MANSSFNARNTEAPPVQTAQGDNRADHKLAYTISEFCAATGIGRTSIYEEIASGRLKAVKAAGRRLILHRDGEAWLQSCRDAAA